MKTYKNQKIERTTFSEYNIDIILSEPNSKLSEGYYLPEKVSEDVFNQIKICRSQTGCRFLKYCDGKPVSIISLALKSSFTGLDKNLISIAYTLPEYRKRGFANELLNEVKSHFKNNLVVSNTLTEDGEKLFKPEQPELKKRTKFKP